MIITLNGSCGVDVSVGVSVGVGVKVGVYVGVSVGVGVKVGVDVGVSVGVEVQVGVPVGVGDGVEDGAGVFVDVGVAVLVEVVVRISNLIGPIVISFSLARKTKARITAIMITRTPPTIRIDFHCDFHFFSISCNFPVMCRKPLVRLHFSSDGAA